MLIALLALMLYRHDGNLIYKILCAVNNENSSRVRKVRRAVYEADLLNDENYKKIEACSCGKNAAMNKKCRVKLLEIKFRIMQNLTDFQPDSYTGYANRVVAWREVFLAPCFVFGFCVLMFAVDELLFVHPALAMYSFQMIFWFMVMSVVFWLCIWGRYLKDAWVVSDIAVASAADDDGEDGHRAMTKEFIFSMILLVILLVTLTCLGMYHKIGPFFGYAFLVIIVLLCVIKGLSFAGMLLSHSANNNLVSYRFILQHFLWIFTGSLLCVLFVCMMYDSPLEYQQFLFDYDEKTKVWNFVNLKMTAFGFIAFFGLLLPFLFPYLIVIHLIRVANKQSEIIRKENIAATEILKADMAAFVNSNNLS
ncbi:MAG: hypothetical protein K2I56_01545 [Muribaculaceae bacterium]|nr:hypothetical protein [Muribaculaceae bacterium]